MYGGVLVILSSITSSLQMQLGLWNIHKLRVIQLVDLQYIENERDTLNYHQYSSILSNNMVT